MTSIHGSAANQTVCCAKRQLNARWAACNVAREAPWRVRPLVEAAHTALTALQLQQRGYLASHVCQRLQQSAHFIPQLECIFWEAWC